MFAESGDQTAAVAGASREHDLAGFDPVQRDGGEAGMQAGRVVEGRPDVGPCDCNVLQSATGHFPEAIARATRLWNDEEVAAATTRLVTRGWLDADGTATDAGIAAREQIEVETDEHCAALWTPIGDANVRRLTSLIMPIHARSPQPGHTPSAWRRQTPGPPIRSPPGSPSR